MIVAKMSHGGVALYDSTSSRLLQWLLMSGTPTGVHVEGNDVTVTFADGNEAVYDLQTGDLERERA